MSVKRRHVYKWFKYHDISINRPKTTGIWDRSPDERKPIKIPVDREKIWEVKFRLKTQPQLRKYLRLKLWQFFKFGRHSKSTSILIGCSLDELKIYISSKFSDGMAIENYATAWEFDHIKPLNSFDLTDPAQHKAAFHFSNLQPLTPHDNAVKGKRESHI